MSKAYDYHQTVRCGSDMDEMHGRLLWLENSNHQKAPQARAVYQSEKRKCSSKSYFKSQVNKLAQEKAQLVLGENITVFTNGIIVLVGLGSVVTAGANLI